MLWNYYNKEAQISSKYLWSVFYLNLSFKLSRKYIKLFRKMPKNWAIFSTKFCLRYNLTFCVVEINSKSFYQFFISLSTRQVYNLFQDLWNRFPYFGDWLVGAKSLCVKAIKTERQTQKDALYYADINTLLCPSKNNSKQIELTVHTWGLRLTLC